MPATVPPHLYSVTALPSKTQLLMSVLHFRMCSILKFTQDSFSSYSILAYLFTAMVCDETIASYCVYACFNCFT